MESRTNATSHEVRARARERLRNMQVSFFMEIFPYEFGLKMITIGYYTTIGEICQLKRLISNSDYFATLLKDKEKPY